MSSGTVLNPVKPTPQPVDGGQEVTGRKGQAILMALLLAIVPISGCLGTTQSSDDPSAQEECITSSPKQSCLESELRPQDCTPAQVYEDSECREMVSPSNLNYGDLDISLYVGVEMTTLTPSFLGDGPSLWMIAPELPQGLELDPDIGTLSGEPLSESPKTVYTIVASNPAGSSSISISIGVGYEPPEIIEAQKSPLICFLDSLCEGEVPMVIGHLPMTWSSDPPLPEGLEVNETGAIEGTPTSLTSGSYAITASNEGGSDTFDLEISIIPPPPGAFGYENTPAEFRVGEDVLLTPTPDPGTGYVWAIQPALPVGLQINDQGAIFGKPIEESGWQYYEVVASNAQGVASTTLQIRVLQNPPGQVQYSESSAILRVGLQMEPIQPLEGYSVDSWSIAPPLPPGISINTGNGSISGTPSSVSPQQSYVVTGANSGGSTHVTITLEVKIQAPTGVQWPSFEISLFRGEQVSITPTNPGPVVDTWSADPPLPAGLQFLENGTIQGTPATRHDWTFHSLWANNSGGSLQQRIWISVIDVEQDQSDLTQGLGVVDYPGYASPILPVGQNAFPIAVAGPDKVPVISGSHVGKGKMIGYGHEAWVDLESNQTALTFALRAVQWACGPNANVGLAAGAGFDSFSNELESEGHEATSAHPDDLTGLDCFVAEFWNGYDESDDEKIIQFLMNGGGLIMGGHSWYWSYSNEDPAHEFPGNRISEVTGLLVSNQPTSDDVDFDWGHNPLMTPRNAIIALNAHSDGDVTLDMQESGLISKCLSPLTSFVPYDYPGFWQSLHDFANQSGWSVIDVDSGHEFGLDPLHDVSIMIESGLVSILPPALLPSHPSHLEFPGPVTPNAPRTETNLTFNSNQTGLPREFGPANPQAMILHSTGLYAPPGEPVTVVVPQELVDSGVSVQVGVHDDTLWHKSKIWRFPSIVRSYPIAETQFEVGNAFGGPIFLASPPDAPLGSTWAEFRGGVEAPIYQHGSTSFSEWQIIRNRSAPWAEISSDQFIMSVPSSEIRGLDNPEELMDFWVEALEMEHELYGFIPWPRIERAAFDIQISAGWMHSGYPFMAHLVSAQEAVDLEHMESEGSWGMFHELGHNHQWNPSRLPGTTETTCNFASVYLMEDLVGLDLGHSALSPQQRHQRMESYFQGGADIDDWSVWTALDTYLIIKEEWGWAPITQALTAYYTLPPSEIPSTDEEEFNAWVLHISSASGYNLAPYHEAWGFPLYTSTHSQLLEYPAWVDDPVRGDYHAFDPIIRNLSAGSTTSSSTQVDWQVYDNGTDVTITLFYGQSDHGNVEGDWPQQTNQGVASVGDWSHVVSGLDPSTTYHARLRAANQNGDIWSDPITWTTSN